MTPFLFYHFPASTFIEYSIGVYCGRLTENKRILLESLQLINKKIPEFRMIVIGDGIDNDKVNLFCKENDWMAWVGIFTDMQRIKGALFNFLLRRYRLYINAYPPYRILEKRFFKSQSGKYKINTCLEVGGGTNPCQNELKRAFAIERYISTDIAPSDMTVDVCNLPFKDGSIKMVVGIHRIVFIPDCSAMLKEIASVVSPGGKILLSYREPLTIHFCYNRL